MCRSVHCDPEANFLPGIPSGDVVDSARIKRGLCDSRRCRGGGTKTRPTYLQNPRRNDRQQGGRNLDRADGI